MFFHKTDARISYIITGFVTRNTRRGPLVEQELSILPEHLRSLPVLVAFVFLDLCSLILCPFALFLLALFDLLLLIAPLVSSNFHYMIVEKPVILRWWSLVEQGWKRFNCTQLSLIEEPISSLSIKQTCKYKLRESWCPFEVELSCCGRVAFPAPQVARRVSIATNPVLCVQF